MKNIFIILIVFFALSSNAQNLESKVFLSIDLTDFHKECIEANKSFKKNGYLTKNISGTTKADLLKKLEEYTNLGRIDLIDTMVLYITAHGDLRNGTQMYYGKLEKNGVSLNDIIKTIKSANKDLIMVVFSDACRKYKDIIPFELPKESNITLITSQYEGQFTQVTGLFNLLFTQNPLMLKDIKITSWTLIRYAVAIFKQQKSETTPHPQVYTNMSNELFNKIRIF